MNTNQCIPFRMVVENCGVLNLYFEENPVQDSFFEHTHNQLEFYLFLEGDAEMVIDGKSHPLRENELIMIPERMPHHLHLNSTRPYRRCIFHVSASHIRSIGLGALIDQFCADVPRIYDLTSTPFLQGLPQYSRVAISASPALQGSLYDERLTALYCTLLSVSTQAQTHKDMLIERAVCLINSKLDQNLTIENISQSLYISGSYLCKIFRQEMKIPLMKYVNRQRIHLARELIMSGVPLKEVYLRCGYDNYVTFFRVFRAETKISPSALSRKE